MAKIFITFPNSTLGIYNEIDLSYLSRISQGKEKPWFKKKACSQVCKFLQIDGFKSNSRTKIGPSLVKIKSSTPKPHYFSEVLSFCLWQEITFFEKKAFEDRKCDVKGEIRVCQKMSWEESKTIA